MSIKPDNQTHATIVIGDARQMSEVADGSVHLVVTSPPYWQLKDYGVEGQIGYHDTYEEYIASLNRVWQECYRTLHPGCRLCVNIGDQFARSVIYGRYKVIPIREEIIRFCESIGFDYMGAIIWQKQTTMNTTGGATVMGSFPFPRNGIVKIDYEFILLFKKLGKPPKVTREQKEASRLTQEEWDTYFAGHWYFAGERQDKHLAMFPEELPRRLIKMFSFVGETVLDPFIGSGTTALAARKLGRNAMGYEINSAYLPLIRAKVGEPLEVKFQPPHLQSPIDKSVTVMPSSLWRMADPKQFQFGSVVSQEDKGKPREEFYRVKGIIAPNVLQLHTGLTVRLLGVQPINGHEDAALAFLSKIALRQRVRLEFDERKYDEDGTLLAYVYSENKTFLNAKIIREGYARCGGVHSRAAHLQRCEDAARRERRGVWAD
ncbi:MAG: DNA methyltransferase [Abditibacteriales bacterium]|nr:DNA methyltransferase [Abditibacteriales bacterium]MDW8366815.1 DNA methyltransferase [Abditibacteriales bacterium]